MATVDILREVAKWRRDVENGTIGGGGGGTPAGSDTEVQFNDSGAFGASPALFWVESGFNQQLTIGDRTQRNPALIIDTQSGNLGTDAILFRHNGIAMGKIEFFPTNDILDIGMTVSGTDTTSITRILADNQAKVIVNREGTEFQTGVRFLEDATDPFDDEANYGQLWLNQSTTHLTFTDEVGNEFDLTEGGTAISGTPVDNQIAVWTDANTIEGDANLTWGGTSGILNVTDATNVTLELESGNTSAQQIISFLDSGGINAQIVASASGLFVDMVHRAPNNITVAAVVRVQQADAGFQGFVTIDAGGSNGVTAQEIVTFEGLVSAGDGLAIFRGNVEVEGYFLPDTATDTELNDITNAINTASGKVQGAMLYNTTQDVPVWAVGNADGSVWVDGAGTTVNTPV